MLSLKISRGCDKKADRDQVTTKAWIKALQTGGSLGKAAAMPSARPRVLEVKPTV